MFTNLLLSGKLDQHLAEIDRSCVDRLELLTQQMAEREGVNGVLKATDQFEWIRQMRHPKPSRRDLTERACLLPRGEEIKPEAHMPKSALRDSTPKS